VLITEDDPDVLTIAAETLRLLGYDVHTATNATEALAILNQGTPIDILFTDIVMPNGMNGIALAREARIAPGDTSSDCIRLFPRPNGRGR